jgi:hypothetical protein
MTDVMIRIDRRCYNRLKEVCNRHPLRPTMKATIERSIDLMVEDLEVEITNANQ